MVTKAIIKKLPEQNNNYFKVYIPFFQKPNDDESDVIFNATLIYTPGITNAYNIDDIVYVTFEDNDYSRPVIIGKLFLNKEETPTTTIQTRVLTVNEKTQLPGNTLIGNVDVGELDRRVKNE